MVIDLDEVVEELLPIPPDCDRKGVALLKRAGLNMVVTVLRDGAELAAHTSRGVVAMQVLAGAVELRTAESSDDVRAGQLAIIDVLEPHSVIARQDATLLITASMLEEIGGDITSHERSTGGQLAANHEDW